MNQLPDQLSVAMEWVGAHARGSVAGQGGDDALFSTACALVNGFDLDEGSALVAMMHYNATRCSPPWTESRLRHKVVQARTVAHEHAPGGLYRWMLREKGMMLPASGRAREGGEAAMPRAAEVGRIPFCLDTLKSMVCDVPPMSEGRLMDASPVPVRGMSSATFLEHLYAPDERVLIFTRFESQGQFLHWCGKGSYRLGDRDGVQAVRSALPRGGTDGVWFLNQPVTGKWEPNVRVIDERTGKPKLSRRSMESVTSWRYLVLESDEAPPELWLKLLVMLPEPIAAIYTSGGRSIHALLRVDRGTKVEWDAYKKLVVGLYSKLGADPAAMTAVRLTRLPGCLRGSREQRLLYLNPRPAAVPIADGGNVLR